MATKALTTKKTSPTALASKKRTKRRHDSVRIPGTAIYKSGSVQSLKGSSCRLYLSYKDDDGKQCKKTRTYRIDGGALTRSEAVKELIRWGQEVDAKAQAALTESKTPTLNEYMDAYITALSLAIERRTVAEYRSLHKRLISQKLGAFPIDELQPENVQTWVVECAESYAPRTVRKALVLLRSAMKQAVERDLLVKDPTRTVKAPKVPTTNPNALDASGRAKVLRFVAIDPADRMNIAVAMALLMGMRRGEVCALRWRSVDLDAAMIHVHESLGRDDLETGEAHWYVKEPKTGGSRRDLNIPAQLIDPLRARLADAQTAAAKMKANYLDYYVVGFDDGTFLNGDQVTAKWHNIVKSLDLVGTQGKPPTFHDLRHTFATAAITNQSADIKTVSSAMGHANAAMTLNIYASADPDAKKRGMQSIADDMLREAAL